MYLFLYSPSPAQLLTPTRASVNNRAVKEQSAWDRCCDLVSVYTYRQREWSFGFVLRLEEMSGVCTHPHAGVIVLKCVCPVSTKLRPTEEGLTADHVQRALTSSRTVRSSAESSKPLGANSWRSYLSTLDLGN